MSFQFTTDNLLDNLDKLGPWTAYGMASEALAHYFPEKYPDCESPSVIEEVKLMNKLGMDSWQEVVEKYHKEVGYTAPDGVFDPRYTNEY